MRKASLLVSNVWGLKPNTKHRPQDTWSWSADPGAVHGPRSLRDSGRLKVCLSKDLGEGGAWANPRVAHPPAGSPSAEAIIIPRSTAYGMAPCSRGNVHEPHGGSAVYTAVVRIFCSWPSHLVRLCCVCILVHHGAGTGRDSELYGRARSGRWRQSQLFAPAEP